MMALYPGLPTPFAGFADQETDALTPSAGNTAKLAQMPFAGGGNPLLKLLQSRGGQVGGRQPVKPKMSQADLQEAAFAPGRLRRKISRARIGDRSLFGGGGR